MKEFFNIKNILILIAVFYLITMIERKLLTEDSQTELLIEHAQEKALLQSEINELNKSIFKYELEILKINADIDSLSNDELDSVWSNMFDSSR